MQRICKKLLIFSIVFSFLYGFDFMSVAEKHGKGVIKNSIDKNAKTTISLKDLLKKSNKIEANIINIPGLLGVGFKCEIDKKVSILDPCALMKPASDKFKLSLGPCELQVGLSNKCIYDFYQKICKKAKGKVISWLTPARASAKNMVDTSNAWVKKHKWSSGCNFFSSKKRLASLKNGHGVSYEQILKTYYSSDFVYKYALPETGNNGIFDSDLKIWTDCVFNNAENGDITTALKKCNINTQKLPKTEYDIKNFEIQSVLALDGSITDIYDNDFKNVLLIQKAYLQQCSSDNTPYVCEDVRWNNGVPTSNGIIKPKKLYNKKIDMIETSYAKFATFVDYATLPDKTMVFLSQDFINTLPVKMRMKAKKQARRLLYQRVLDKYFIKQMVNLDEESLSINYDAQKITASVFYPQNAVKEINTYIQYFSKAKAK